MTSSLATQLAQVRSLNADRLSGARAASKVQSTSYLFPPSVAATQDLETVYGIASNGWEELCESDSAFDSWGSSTGSAALLFGESSKDLDRLTKTQEENTIIDTAISGFFLLVGDNLLDRSAGKCIEWLVRRFRAHEYNVDAILAAFMPFHETQEFARMLQIVNLRGKPQFGFLAPVQKQSIPLPSSVLLSTLLEPPQTTNSTVVLRWIVSLPLDYNVESSARPGRRTRHVACSFWLSVIVKLCSLWSGAGDIFTRMGLTKSLGKRKQARDDDAQSLLSILLPAILRLAHAADTVRDAHSYASMALCAVANAFDLSADAARGVIESIASVSTQAKRSRAALLTACASILSRQQATTLESSASDRPLSAEAARRLAVMLGDGHVIANLTSGTDWSSFAEQLGLALTSAEEDDDASHAAILWIFSKSSGLSQEARSVILRRLLSHRREISQALADTLSTIRQAEPQAWEQTFSSLMRDANDEVRRRLERLMSSLIARQAGLDADDADTTEWLAVYGAEAAGRLSSWRSIAKAIESGKLDPSEQVVKDTLSMILTEGNADNLAEAYSNPTLILKIIGVESLIDIIQAQVQVENKNGDKEGDKVVFAHIGFVLHSLIMRGLADEAQQSSVFGAILWPRLLATKAGKRATHALLQQIQEAVRGVKNMKQTAVQNVLVKVASLAQKKDLTSTSQGNLDLASAICEVFANHSGLLDLLARQREGRSDNALMSNLVLLQSLRLGEGQKLVRTAIRNVQEISKRAVPTQSSSTIDDLLNEALDKVFNKPASDAALSAVLISLLASLAQYCPVEGASLLGGSASALQAAASVFSVAASLTQTNPTLSKSILSGLVKRLHKSSISFLAEVWTSCDENGLLNFDATVRFLALRFASAYFDGQRKSHDKQLVDFQTLVPSVLVALQDPEKRNRVEALNVVEILLHLATQATKGETESKSVQIFGYDVLYGPVTVEGLTYLDTAEVSHLLNQLHEARNSFVNDPAFLSSWLREVLTVQKGEGKKLSSRKKAVLHCLSTHVLCWTNVHARIVLLQALVGVSGEVRLRSMLPLIRQSIDGEPGSEELQGLLFALYDKSARAMIANDENECWTLFTNALIGKSASAQRQSARALRERTFAILTPERQSEVVNLLAASTTRSDVVLQTEVRKCLASLHIDASVLVPVLINVRESISSQLTATPKRKRSRISSDDSQGANVSVSILLELLENLLSQRQVVTSALMTELFEILRLATELYLSSFALAEQLLQVTMSNINKLMTVSKSSTESANADTFEPIRVESLVNIIKLPCKPQTFQQALLLLSLVSQSYPDLVLQHSMPIFSFVGSTVLQRDDEHSFNVIEKTLASILPPVVHGIEKDKDAKRSKLAFMQASRPVLCIFTDAAMHVPRHRRQMFFNLLADVAGLAQFTAPLCMLLVDRQAYKIAKLVQKDDIEAGLQLPLSLFRHAEDDVDVLLATLGEAMEEVTRTWKHRSDDPDTMQKHVFLDCLRDVDSEHGGRKMDPIKRITSLLHFVRLAIDQNRDAIEDARVEEEDEQSNRRDNILQAIVHHALALTRSGQTSIVQAAQQALDEVMTVVSVSTLEHVTSALLSHKDVDSQRNGLQIVSTALDSMMEAERRQAAAFVPQVIVKCKSLLQSTSVDAQVSALDALRSILAQPQTSEHAALAEVTLTIAQIGATNQDAMVAERAMDVLRRLCETLGPRLIPMLASLVSSCQEVVLNFDSERRRQENALNILTALVRSVPSFMSTHIADIFDMCAKHEGLTESGSMRKMLSAACRYVAPTDVLQAIATVRSAGSHSDVHTHLFCLDVLQLCIRSMDKQRTMKHHKQIFRFLILFFDSRRQSIVAANAWSLTSEEIELVESRSVSVFIRLVFRLSEAVFRPLFLRLCDWALLDLTGDDDDDEDESDNQNTAAQIRARKVVLYKVLNALLQELGELVTHYYGNVLDSTIETLSKFGIEGESEETLWEPIVNSIKLCSSADSSGFWNAERTNKVMPALISQIRTSVVLNSTAMQSLLADTISQLCSNVSDESCVKKANDGLLILTRDVETNGTQSRLIALHVLDRLWRTKGCEDGLLTLVPETVPSIAELLQEGEASLLPAVNNLVNAIEEILGEGLESYLQ